MVSISHCMGMSKYPVYTYEEDEKIANGVCSNCCKKCVEDESMEHQCKTKVNRAVQTDSEKAAEQTEPKQTLNYCIIL